MSSLDELVERVVRDMTQDTPKNEDIHRLVSKVLDQREVLNRLATENESLTQRLAALEAKVESLEPFTHLVQFAEGSI
jgi:BMFP domain-containing protein YqiC